MEAVLQRYPRASTPRPEPRIVEIGDGLSEPIRRVGMRHVTERRTPIPGGIALQPSLFLIAVATEPSNLVGKIRLEAR